MKNDILIEAKFGDDSNNCAPALVESSIGLAMGIAGTNAAHEVASVEVMGNDSAKIPYTVHLSSMRKRLFSRIVFLDRFACYRTGTCNLYGLVS